MGLQCKAEVEALGAEIRVGTVYDGKVVSVKDFGAFIELAPGTDGMCHISELDHGYVKSVGDIVTIGDTVKVKVINVDDTGRIKLSRRALIEPPADGEGGEEGEGGHRRLRLAAEPPEPAAHVDGGHDRLPRRRAARLDVKKIRN